MKPHQTFSYIRADEIAECWEGVPEALYLKLWNDIVPLQKAIPNLEDTGPADHVGHENLAAHWHLLTGEEQKLLNGLAEAQEAESRQWLAESRAVGESDPCAPDNHFLADLPNDIESDNASAVPATAPVIDMRGPLTTAHDAKAYILAGKSTITLVSGKTGTRFTYRITAAPDNMAYFVGLLSGPDNTADYSYLGRIAIRPAGAVFYVGRKTPKPGDVSPDAPSAKAFYWTWKLLAQGTMPDLLQIWHEGRCGRCGRKLTVPSSIVQGFGPECIGKL